jgi:hypothetical protein
MIEHSSASSSFSINRENSLNKLADNTNKSLHSITSGFAASSSALKSTAGAWTKIGGAFLSKLSSTTQSPATKIPDNERGSHMDENSHSSLAVSGGSLEDVIAVEPCHGENVLFPSPSRHSVGVGDVSSGFDEKWSATDLKESTTQVLNRDLKAGSFTINSNLLFRYPSNVDPPPSEVCDFCMPSGAKLQFISNREGDDNVIQDILFGNTHGRRSGRSFVFMIEDKTDDKNVSKVGRLYGICVVHPRFLRTNVLDQARKLRKQSAKSPSDNISANTNPVDSMEGNAQAENVEFESFVCYAFITRFPFFDFFFQVLYDIIGLEKLRRIEVTNDLEDRNYENSKDLCEYLPTTLLTEVLDRLSQISPPFAGSSLFFQVDQGLQPITFQRLQSIPSLQDEYITYLSQWCLPTLFSCVSPDCLVWLLSLVLVECKLIVVGSECGLISCVVLGLLTLLKPFDWISPVIPLLPNKLSEFIEAPVPIMVGLVSDPLDPKTNVSTILKQCR